MTFMRCDDNDEFVVVINFSNRPVNTARSNFENGPDFQPVKISGTADVPTAVLPLFHLNGFEWRIYHRVAVEISRLQCLYASRPSPLYAKTTH